MKLKPLCVALVVLVTGCSQIEHRQLLAEPTNKVLTVPVGGSMATISKEKDLPNAFGKADIYGRKVETGMIKIVYKGVDKSGSPLIEQVDVDVHSNASVFTRMPGMYSASSSGNMYGSAVATGGVATGTVQGSSNAYASAMTPQAETNIVLPPNVNSFSVPKGRSLTLASGETIEFINAEPHQVTYRISAAPAPTAKQ